MAEEITNANITSIRRKIKETEADINVLTERIKTMEEPRAKITAEYEDKKNKFEEFKKAYVQQSTYGVYFLVVSFIAFVFIAYKVIDHSMVSFMIFPAAGLLIAGIVGKVMGDRKFQSMSKKMVDVEMEFAEAKDKYDTFMQGYNADVSDLEKKQYEWELVENNMIEAKKDAWIAQHKTRRLVAPAPAPVQE